jgi:hypothetical protein
VPDYTYSEDEVEDIKQQEYDRGFDAGQKDPRANDRHDMHFMIHPQDLADAIYRGTIPSRCVNGSGTSTDARLQAARGTM